MEVILRWKIFGFLLLIQIQAFAKYSPPKIQFTPPSSLDKINHSKEDYLFGETLVDVIRQVKRGKLNKGLTLKLATLSRKSDAYSDFKEFAASFNNIINIKNNQDFFKYCNSDFNRKDLSFTQKRVVSYINKLCWNKFLNILIESPIHTAIKPYNLKQLDKYLKRYLRGEFLREFVKLLTKTKGNKVIHRIVSDRVINAYLNSDIYPKIEIVKNIELNEEMESYLAHEGYDERLFQKSLLQDLKKLKKEVYDCLEKFEYKLALKKSKELRDFFYAKRSHIDHKEAWKTFLHVGRRLNYFSLKKEAQELFETALDLGNKQQKEEIVFWIISDELAGGDYKDALQEIKRFNLIKNFDDLGQKLAYWVAYTLDKAGDKKMAKDFFVKIVRRESLSYYSVISLKYLINNAQRMFSKHYMADMVTSRDYPRVMLESYGPLFTKAVRRLTVWSELKDYRMIVSEINHILEMSQTDVFKKGLVTNLSEDSFARVMVLNIASFLTKRNEFIHAFKMIYSTLNNGKIILDKNIMSLLFPLKYFSMVANKTKKLDPFVILSLIRQESAFNPEAISHAGARGLMQLMPHTAKDVARKSKLVKSKLKDPDFNLKLGIKYFKSLLKKYNGNLVYSLAAYNAGERRLKYWVEKVFPSNEPLLVIENIPYKETRQYVKLIYRNIFFYRLMSDASLVNSDIKESFSLSMN